MIGDSRRSRVFVLASAVAASAAASGVVVASCVERGVETQARHRSEARGRAMANAAAKDAASDEPVSDAVITSAELRALVPPSSGAPPTAAVSTEPEMGAATETATETAEAQPAAPESAAPPPGRSLAEVLDQLGRTLERGAVATPTEPAPSQPSATPAAEPSPNPEGEGEGAYESAATRPAAPSPEERAAEAQRIARSIAGTPVERPRFQDIGAGAFLTEPQLGSASAMTSDPSAGAGAFTTETTISPSIIYFGAPSLTAFAPPQGQGSTPAAGAGFVPPPQMIPSGAFAAPVAPVQTQAPTPSPIFVSPMPSP